MQKQKNKPETIQELQKLHEILRETFHKFMKVAKEADVTIFPYAGSFMGAEWYEDILPWDDDIDVVIHWEDFKKLKKVIEKSSDLSMTTFYDDNHENLIAKIHNNEGVLIEDKSSLRTLGEKGPFIDLSILFPVPNSKFKKTILNKKLKVLRLALLSKRKSLSTVKKVVYKTISAILFLTKKRAIKKIENILENKKNYSSFSEMNTILSTVPEFHKDSIYKEISFINHSFSVPSIDFENAYTEIKKIKELKPMPNDVPRHIESFSSTMNSEEYNELLNVASTTTKEKTATIFLMNDIYSSGGIEEYNKKIVSLLLEEGYTKINWISTKTNSDFVIKNVIDPRINQIHLNLKTKGIINYILNIFKVKTKLRKILCKSNSNLVILNPYFSYAALNKRIQKNTKVISILHSSNDWIDKYLSSNIVRKLLFKKHVKYIDHIFAYPHHKDLKSIDSNKMIFSTPFHNKIVNKEGNNKRDKVLYCSRVEFDYYKNVGDFIELSKIDDHNFLIAGMGSPKSISRVEKEVESSKNLKYFGRYSPQTLRSLFDNAICQVMTSGVRGEGFGISFVEAASYGMPILIRRQASQSIDILAKEFGDDWFLYDDIKDIPQIISKIENDWEYYSKSIKDFYARYLSEKNIINSWKEIMK